MMDERDSPWMVNDFVREAVIRSVLYVPACSSMVLVAAMLTADDNELHGRSDHPHVDMLLPLSFEPTTPPRYSGDCEEEAAFLI